MTTTELAPLLVGSGTNSAVTVCGLTKRFGGRPVLDGLDLEVRRGECFALLAGRGRRDRIGVVAQGEGGGPALSVRETLDHFAGYHAVSRPTAELLSAVGLAESAGVRVERLSGGQRRRLAVALGVQGRPELLFLDEPTTGMAFAKLGVDDRTRAVLVAVERGLPPSPGR